ncbi:MAG TPA: hypothetical protein VF691_12145, partial [Cytophagaceae bacterium]
MRSILSIVLIFRTAISFGQVFNNYYDVTSSTLTGQVGIQAEDGGFVFGGTTSDGNDIHVTKVNSQGEVSWTHRYDLNKANLPEFVTGICLSRDNGFLIVGTSFNDQPGVVNGSDAFVMKIDRSGNYNWSRAISQEDETGLPNGEDKGMNIQQLSDGSIVVAMDVSNDGAIVMLNEGGDYLNGSAVSSVKVVSAGGCCPSAFEDTETLKGGILSANSEKYFAVGNVSRGLFYYYYLLNFNLVPGTGTPSVSFGKMLGGSSEKKSLMSIDGLPDGSYVACGYTEEGALGGAGDRDGVVIRFSSSGVVVWAKKIGSTAMDSLSNVTYDGVTGNIACVGVTNKFAGAGRGIGIIMDTSGNIISQSSLENSSVISDISPATENRYIVTGTNQNRLHVYTASKAELSNSVCAASDPALTISDISIGSQDIDPSFNSSYSISNTLNNHSNGSAVINTDLRSTITRTTNLPSFGISKVYPATVCEGNGVARFYAQAVAQDLTYQWLENGVPITDNEVYSRTGYNMLSITNPGSSLNGKTYSLRATASCGSIISNSAALTVIPNSPTLTPGKIGTSQNLCAPGTPAPLTELQAAAGGSCVNYSYIFEKSEDNGTTWSKINRTTIATWDFEGNGQNSTVSAGYKNPEINDAVIGLGAGFSSLDYLSNSFAAVRQEATTLSEAILNNDYISIVVTPAPGQQLNITKLKFRPVSQNRTRTFAIYSTVNGFDESSILTSTVVTSDLQTTLVDIPITGHSNLSTAVEFRIYIYGYTDTFESVGFGNRDLRINEVDFIIEGSAPKIFAPPALSVTTLYRRKVFCNCDSVVSAPVKINIGSKPTVAASSNSPTCIGEAINLKATGGVGTTVIYSWTGPGGFTSLLQNPVVTSSSASTVGDYSVTVTVDDCKSDPATVTTSLKQIPDNSPDNTARCADGSSTKSLITTTPGGTWSLDPTSTSGVGTVDNATAQFTVGNSPGNAIINYTLNGCITPKTIVVNALPTTIASGNSNICAGSTLTLAATGTGTFSWTGPNNFQSQEQNPVLSNVTTAQSGSYLVTRRANGCNSLPSNVSIVINAQPEISVTTTNPSTCGGTGSATITITNSSGSYSVDLNGDGTYEPSYSNLSPDASGKIIISQLSNGTVVKNVKVKSSSTGCESSNFQIDVTITSPSSPDNSTDNTAMCADGSSTKSLITTTPGGTWSLDPTSTAGVGTV